MQGRLDVQVFSEVAARVVESALEGFNGTVFAYGSTGSGKTFTITGGMQRYEDRGLVPRAIGHAFSCMAEHPDHAYQVQMETGPEAVELAWPTPQLVNSGGLRPPGQGPWCRQCAMAVERHLSVTWRSAQKAEGSTAVQCAPTTLHMCRSR